VVLSACVSKEFPFLYALRSVGNAPGSFRVMATPCTEIYQIRKNGNRRSRYSCKNYNKKVKFLHPTPSLRKVELNFELTNLPTFIIN
jgi:hypothetical protein